MRIKNLFIAVALLLAGGMVLSTPSGFAANRKRAAKRQTTAAAPAVKKTPKTLQKDGTTVSITNYDSPAFYKVVKSEAGFSNGYCDNSFSIDWPTAVSTGDVTNLQQWLLSLFSHEQKMKSVDALIANCNKCDYNGTRVAKIPEGEDEFCLSDRGDVKAQLITANLLEFSLEHFAYFGGGTGASIVEGTSYYYYDLEKERVLTFDDLFRRQVVDAIVSQLQDNGDWDFLWDEFKASPSAPENFSISSDKVVFVYGKYEIAPGAAGNVEAEVPLQQVLPYATPLFKTIVEAMER